MSIRSLIEINHDYTSKLDDPAFTAALRRYLCSGDSKAAEELRAYGVVVVSQRHHSGVFHIGEGTDGFRSPPMDTVSAAKRLGVSASYLNKLRLTGAGPEFLKLGAKVVYEPAALDAWINSCRRTSTAQYPGDAA